MDRIGTPINLRVPKESEDFGINWEISPETIKAIEEIEDIQRRSAAYLAYCWHYYV